MLDRLACWQASLAALQGFCANSSLKPDKDNDESLEAQSKLYAQWAVAQGIALVKEFEKELLEEK